MATKLMSKTVAVSMAAAMLTVTAIPVSSADAGGRKHHRKHYHNGDLLGAGIIGLTLGAIIIGSAEHRRRRADHIYQELPAYVPPQHVHGYQPEYYYEEPQVIIERPYRDEYSYNEPTVLPDYRRENRRYEKKRHQRKSRKSEPKVITYDQAMNRPGLAEPWTPAWVSYCKSKFRSFNASSGTYLGYDGKRHFCVPK